jgi:hypothetical protein
MSVREKYSYKFILAITLILTLFWTNLSYLHAQTSTTVSIDFSNIKEISPLAFGIDESAYGAGGKNLSADSVERDMIKKLKVSQVRFELKVSGSSIICGAAGCPATVGADTWINSIRATGADPIVIVPDNEADAAKIVKYFNKDLNSPIKRWIVGNEPDNHGITAAEYSARFNAAYDAMKAIDPNIKIAGPATAWFNKDFIQTFLNTSGSKVDIIDYHTYGQGGTVNRTEAELFAESARYEQQAAELRTMLTNTLSTKGRAIDIQVGEWNMDWDSDAKYITHFNTVWSASALGHIIKSGMHALPYATKNGDLGALYETTNEPMPLYHGIGMFTGEGFFQKFGTQLATVTTTSNNLEVFASDNPKSIVVVNKSPTAAETASFAVNEILSGSTLDVWRKDKTQTPKANPAKITGVNVINNSFSYSFPAYSVTTFVPASTTSTVSVTTAATQTPASSIIPSQACPKKSSGDADCNGNVDLADFQKFRDEYIKQRNGQLDINAATSDFTGDKSVDLSDFVAFRQGYINGLTPTATATANPTVTPTSPPVSVVPSALGFGAKATKGGRGGSVMYVSNLNDSGSGSLREALGAARPRTILFKVSGTINLASDLEITNPYVTIAGQTAPGQGVQIKGGMLKVRTHDVLIRYLKIRAGDEINQSPVATRDAISISDEKGEVFNVVVDHCSLLWGPNVGGLSIAGNVHDVTVQNTIMGEGLKLSSHPLGATIPGHSSAVSIMETTTTASPKFITFHHNLMTTSNTGMPMLAGGENIDIVNNVIYNWGEKSAHGNPKSLNLISNVFIKGPQSVATNFWLPEALVGTIKDGTVFESGNAATGFTGTRGGSPTTYAAAKFTPYSMTLEQTSQQAFNEVISTAGANKQSLNANGQYHIIRDSDDQRLINNVDIKQGGFMNGAGKPSPNPTWPTLTSGTPVLDSDNDGLADAWENYYFKDLNRGSGLLSNGDQDGDGFTDLEEYLNSTNPTTTNLGNDPQWESKVLQ